MAGVCAICYFYLGYVSILKVRACILLGCANKYRTVYYLKCILIPLGGMTCHPLHWCCLLLPTWLHGGEV